MSEQDELYALRELLAQLTGRVYRLEQIVHAPPPASPSERAAVPPAPAALPGLPHATPVPPPAAEFRSSELQNRGEAETQTDSLERRIGSQWLNRIGVVAVLVGVSYFLKLAIDNGWIGPGLRVMIGLIAGAGLCWWSERFRRTNALAFSYSLKAVGVGVLYLSLWASFQLYHLLPGTIAFLAMVLVTAATAGVAIAQDAELLAGLALLGGLLTPVLCESHENHEAVLFCYLLLLSLGAFVLQRVKPWPRILVGAFAGSCLLGGAWFSDYYSNDQFAESILFFTLLFALFALAPLFAMLEPERDGPTRMAGLLLAVLNAAAYFLAVYALLERLEGPVPASAAACALALAVVYAGLAVALDRRVGEHPGVERLLPMAHYGLAITFLTIAIPLRLHEHWITMAWLMEGAVLFWAGSGTTHRRVKLFGGAVVAIGLLRLLALDLWKWGEQPLILNLRLATFAVAIGALLWMTYLDSRSPDGEADEGMMLVAAVTVNLLVLLAAGLEIHDTFGPLIRATMVNRRDPAYFDMQVARHSLAILRNFSYSALFMLYGAGLMWLGFVRKSALLRWQAILLIAATVIKVFLFDASALDRGWRVLSFIILGALLLAVSYAYQRDWLGLQRPRSE
ncbi:MAG: DUF2339 domain-containing protein [Candidatus Korobacteraceae bacterium]|jgi:uncharacterized membrane protein